MSNDVTRRGAGGFCVQVAGKGQCVALHLPHDHHLQPQLPLPTGKPAIYLPVRVLTSLFLVGVFEENPDSYSG